MTNRNHKIMTKMGRFWRFFDNLSGCEKYEESWNNEIRWFPNKKGDNQYLLNLRK